MSERDVWSVWLQEVEGAQHEIRVLEGLGTGIAGSEREEDLRRYRWQWAELLAGKESVVAGLGWHTTPREALRDLCRTAAASHHGSVAQLVGMLLEEDERVERR